MFTHRANRSTICLTGGPIASPRSARRGRSAHLPVAAMVAAMAATWFLISRTTTGRQLYAFGDNPEGARRAGVATVKMQFIAYGWMGLMAGVGGLMQVNLAQEVVPNALIGRELDVLAAVVLGGARLGGGVARCSAVFSASAGGGRAKRAQSARRLALRLQDGYRADDPRRHLALER